MTFNGPDIVQQIDQALDLREPRLFLGSLALLLAAFARFGRTNGQPLI
jgi:hypothetical protein